MVIYQRHWSDQWLHRYTYDADNRLVLVETSPDSLSWETEARYDYYKHGPLARMTLGAQQVQGVDYAYTLQGWLKGINSTGGTRKFDMGGDGDTMHVNRYTAADAMGLTLDYHAGDYAAISNAVPFPGWSGALNNDYRPLYNGNISSTSVYQKRFAEGSIPGGGLIFYNYKYDQLNRLVGQDAYSGSGFNAANSNWDSLPSMGERLKERISYDANGNILKYLRNGIEGTAARMDSLTYHYYAGSNKLSHIADSVGANTYPTASYLVADLDSQAVNNYGYDSIGNLVRDDKERITNIKWNVYGKIQEITRTATAELPATNIKYTYDASGNRISQLVTHSDGKQFYTWYVRDGQGNILSTYTAQDSTSSPLANLDLQYEDRFIYGSSRIGTYNAKLGVGDGPEDIGGVWYEGGPSSRGYRQYELTNHLGNVLAVVSDKKFGVSLGGSSLIEYYEPEIVSATDYYPFGMVSRYAAGKYRFGFNGKENDNEVKGYNGQQDYGMRIYDPRVGRFLSVDPITKEYPELTPYQFASNTPIWAIDLDGKEADFFNSPEFLVEYHLSKLRHPNASDWKLYIEAIPNAIFRAPGVETTTRGLVAPLDVIEYTNRNSNQKDPKIRAENEKQAQQAGTDVIIGFGVGKLTGKTVQGTKMVYQEFKALSKTDPMITALSRKPTAPLASSRVTIGLGIDEDLANHRGTGAVTYKNAGWQQAGLTNVDWGKALMDEFSFKSSFLDAVMKADAIRFDVTNFKPSMTGMTQYEFNQILSNKTLYQKTTFIQNGAEVTWDGSQFIKK